MKKEIAAYVARCDTCYTVKVIHLKPVGLLQPLSIPGWKLEEISMDFIVLVQKLICKHKGLIPDLNVKPCQPI